MARAPRSPAPRRCPPLAAAPLVAAASPVNPAVRTTAATASRLAAAAAALPLAAERCLASLLTRPAARCAHSLWVSLCTLSPSLYYPAVRTTAATASRLAAALPLAAERCLASLLTRRPAALRTAYGFTPRS